MKFYPLGRAVLALAALSSAAPLLTSCGGHTIGYAYVTSSPSTGTSTVFSYKVSSDNGHLSPAVTPATLGAATGAIASVSTPDGLNLYVLYGSPTNVLTGQPLPSSAPGLIVHYAIQGHTGNITPVDQQNTAGTDPVALAIDPSSSYLYALDTFSGNFGFGNPGPGDVTAYGIQGQTGSSNAVPAGTIIAPSSTCPGTQVLNGVGCGYIVGLGPRGVAQTAASNGSALVIVANSGNTSVLTPNTCYGTISGFTFSNGLLTPVSLSSTGSPTGSCAGTIAVPSGSLVAGNIPWAVAATSNSVYITDYALNQVYEFTTAAGGCNTDLCFQGQTGTGSAPEFALVGSGTGAGDLFISNFKDNNISSYSIGSTGQLTPSGTFVTGQGPTCMAIDVTGTYFYATNYISGSVTGATIGAGGVLTLLPDTPFLVGTTTTGVNTNQPTCITVTLNGH